MMETSLKLDEQEPGLNLIRYAMANEKRTELAKKQGKHDSKGSARFRLVAHALVRLNLSYEDGVKRSELAYNIRQSLIFFATLSKLGSN